MIDAEFHSEAEQFRLSLPVLLHKIHQLSMISKGKYDKSTEAAPHSKSSAFIWIPFAKETRKYLPGK